MDQVFFHDKRHPKDMGEPGVWVFLTHLAVHTECRALSEKSSDIIIQRRSKEPRWKISAENHVHAPRFVVQITVATHE